jgi:hypothetical protein
MMRFLPAALAVACAMSLTAASGAADAPATKFPIFGTWEITKFALAPWIEEGEDRSETATDGAAHLHLLVAFEARRVIAKDDIVGCTEANYEPTSFPPDVIFQGGLPAPDQAKLATEMGFAPGDIPGFDLDCSTSLFSYHFADADTLLFALSDVIYTLTRKQ